MEIKAAVKRYETRRKTGGAELPSKARVDWRRTKREIILLDSDEESSDDEGSATSEEDADEKDEIVVIRSLSDGEEKSHNETVTEDAEDEHIMPGKRKRSSTSILYDSDESEDSDILVRKVFAKRHCIMDEDESSQEQHPDKTSHAENISTSRKQQVLAKLKELARQRASRASSSSGSSQASNAQVEEEPLSPLLLTSTEGSEADNDSMKDFIDDDEEEEEDDNDNTDDIRSEKQPQQKKIDQISNSQLLEYYVPHFTRCSHYEHFQRIVKAFLINAIDDSFLSSLYDGTRQKKYAQDMLTSLHYLDDRFIQPRLENLISRSRWKDRYKERVDCYPDVRIIMKNPQYTSCQACELNRYCKFDVLLSGKLYNSRTLEADDFMSHDKQVLRVGTVCADRTRVYHNLKHFKYKLYVNCSSVAELDGVEDEPVKDTVERLFSQLEGRGWIRKRYDDLENYMNDADNFQEEKMD